MKPVPSLRSEPAGDSTAGHSIPAQAVPASDLWRVSPHELAGLRAALAGGRTPVDLSTKLAGLNQAGLIHQFVEQNSRLLLALVTAVADGEFPGVSDGELEHLLRVLAYVRKDDDLVPDFQTGGYVDDHREIRLALRELEPIIQAFKQWRLRHQVPAMWAARAVGRPGTAR